MRFVLPLDSVEAGPDVLFLCPPGARGSLSGEIPLRFTRTADAVEILAPRATPPAWARALTGGGPVAWRIDGRTAEGTAESVEDPSQLRAIVDRFRSRFGDGEVARWFGGAVFGFRLEEFPPAVRYRDRVAAYFDRLAPTYDRSVESNPLDQHLRSLSNAMLGRVFAAPDRVLEIGCGTGLESIPLARRGVRVVATDLSPAMLARLSRKAADEGLSALVETREAGAAELGRILAEYGPRSFDGAFSDFGALNCEPDLTPVASALRALVRPGGRLVLGIWNRYCASEVLLALAGGRPRRALARVERPVPVGRSRYGIPVFARGPGEVLAAFRPGFEAVRLTGLSVFVPPYDFAPSLGSRVTFMRLMEGLDGRLGVRFPFNRIGDHFLLQMRHAP